MTPLQERLLLYVGTDPKRSNLTDIICAGIGHIAKKTCWSEIIMFYL